jgi:hypothetical protein
MIPAKLHPMLPDKSGKHHLRHTKNFTMDLAVVDAGLFDRLAQLNNVPAEISALVLKSFKDLAQGTNQTRWLDPFFTEFLKMQGSYPNTINSGSLDGIDPENLV